jgi:hypothetical protein
VKTEIDVLIPVGPNDEAMVPAVVASVRRFVEGVADIYIVSQRDQNIPDTRYIPETAFPFDKAAVVSVLGSTARAGWYLQQLIKLYFSFVVPTCNERLLVVDSDTLFLRPCSFWIGARPAFNVGRELNREYFRHMRRLHPALQRITCFSGITHCMPFERRFLRSLFRLVEGHHDGLPRRTLFVNRLTRALAPPIRYPKQVPYLPSIRDRTPSSSARPFWRIFLEEINVLDPSAASEYEIYFNYCLAFQAERVAVVPKSWVNVESISQLPHREFDYACLHYYMRRVVPGEEESA